MQRHKSYKHERSTRPRKTACRKRYGCGEIEAKNEICRSHVIRKKGEEAEAFLAIDCLMHLGRKQSVWPEIKGNSIDVESSIDGQKASPQNAENRYCGCWKRSMKELVPPVRNCLNCQHGRSTGSSESDRRQTKSVSRPVFASSADRMSATFVASRMIATSFGYWPSAANHCNRCSVNASQRYGISRLKRFSWYFLSLMRRNASNLVIDVKSDQSRSTNSLPLLARTISLRFTCKGSGANIFQLCHNPANNIVFLKGATIIRKGDSFGRSQAKITISSKTMNRLFNYIPHDNYSVMCLLGLTTLPFTTRSTFACLTGGPPGLRGWVSTRKLILNFSPGKIVTFPS